MTPTERSEQRKASAKDGQNSAALPLSLMQKGTGQLVHLKTGRMTFWTGCCVGSQDTGVQGQDFSRILRSHHLQTQPVQKQKQHIID